MYIYWVYWVAQKIQNKMINHESSKLVTPYKDQPTFVRIIPKPDVLGRFAEDSPWTSISGVCCVGIFAEKSENC
jgi:hypothetical protein